MEMNEKDFFKIITKVFPWPILFSIFILWKGFSLLKFIAEEIPQWTVSATVGYILIFIVIALYCLACLNRFFVFFQWREGKGGNLNKPR